MVKPSKIKHYGRNNYLHFGYRMRRMVRIGYLQDRKVRFVGQNYCQCIGSGIQLDWFCSVLFSGTRQDLKPWPTYLHAKMDTRMDVHFC